MVQTGDKVILLDDNKAVSESTPKLAEECVLVKESLSRAESGAFNTGDSVALVSPNKAMASAGLKPFGNFGVKITGTNSPIGETASLMVDVDVTNNSSDQQKGNIVLYIDPDVGATDGREVDIPGGETHSITLTWQTENGDAGDYTARVESGTDKDTTGVTVEDVTNPEEKTYSVPESDSLSLSDRENNEWKTGVLASSLSNIRFIECRLTFTQKGTYYSNDSGIGLDIGLDGEGVDYQPVQALVGPGETFDKSATWDLKSTKTGDLYLYVDDGDGTAEGV